MNTYIFFHDCCELEIKTDSYDLALATLQEWFSTVEPGNGRRSYKWNEYSCVTENGIVI